MHEITEKYKSNKQIYEDFKLKMEELVKELVAQEKINPHKIESKIKDVNKLEEKIVQKNDKYNGIADITDIVGVRVITYFEDEVDKVAKIIEDEFIIDKQNSIDKRKLEADRFGYRSLHYVLSLNEQRKKLTEYKKFIDLKFEIQIRSILQHAWAEIEHDIGYKGELSIPNLLKRNFYRVAALLETADIEFVNIKNKQKQYEKNVKDDIKKKPEDVEINFASLRSYVQSSDIVLKLDKAIALKFKKELMIDYFVDEQLLVRKLYFLNIKTIKSLDTLLHKNENEIIPFAYYWISETGGIFPRAVSISYLCYVLVGKKNDINFASEYFRKFFSIDAAFSGNKGSKIIETYKKIK